MIWILICIGVLVAGIICAIVDSKMWRLDGWLDVIGFVSIIVSGVILVVAIGAIISVNVNTELDYQNKLHERDMLEYRIEHMEDNTTGNEMLYNDIVEFNNELRATKKWANSPWTNWFNNQKIASMDYIELVESNEKAK